MASRRCVAELRRGEIRKLTARERATIVSWARAGGRIDGPARKPLKPKSTPVPAGERLLDLRMPVAYKPSAPKGTTDDYRCFLLDPKLAADGSVTSARIVPGAAKVVHHVILFRVTKAQVADAKQLDRADSGHGWTCFGGPGLSLGDGGRSSSSTTRTGSPRGRPAGAATGSRRARASRFPPEARS